MRWIDSDFIIARFFLNFIFKLGGLNIDSSPVLSKSLLLGFLEQLPGMQLGIHHLRCIPAQILDSLTENSADLLTLGLDGATIS